MTNTKQQNPLCTDEFRTFFENHHDKIFCTANKNGEPSVALMGTPRLNQEGNIELALSDDPSITLNNILENKSVVFFLYETGLRARDYKGVRVYAEAIEILTNGDRLEMIREKLRKRFGSKKADELVAIATFRITKLRPVIDRGQPWNESPLLD